mmetsp:Transcript_11090/g.26312  ORF Transcript_11090/g.26312 Transcript_11090/m.26312 type:complete len:228 (+) Transcript_11090:323-1006(+)
MLELVHACCTDDCGGHKPTAVAPSQCELRGRQAVLLSNLGILDDRLADHRLLVAGHVPWEDVEPRLLRVAVDVLPGEDAARQRRVGEEADIAVGLGAGLGKVGLEWHPDDERVGVLNRHDRGEARGFCRPAELHHAPRRFVGHSDVANLSSLNELVQGHQLLLEWDRLAHVLNVEPRLPKQRDVAVRPVQLQEVYVVCSEPREALIDALENLRPCQPGSLPVLPEIG